MANYQTISTNEHQQVAIINQAKSRSFIGSIMLVICIISFVLQTELSQYVQRTTNYSKPYFILYLSHSCYMVIIPFQLLVEYFKNPQISLKQTIENWKQRVQSSISELPTPILSRTVLKLAILLCIPSYLWYLSVNLISASNLTAIYNTSCLFAYVFSILLLHDPIVTAKIGAVVLCMIGVAIMAFYPTSTATISSNSMIGIITATIGAASVGYYEVYYKKYASPTQPTILFANTLSGGIGVATFFLLWIPIVFLHYFKIEVFQWPDLNTFIRILMIAAASMVYNATCMAVIALVSPVFAAVGVMLTIPAVAITDIFITGEMVPLSTVLGSLFILIGFFILNKRIYEEEKEQQQTDNHV